MLVFLIILHVIVCLALIFIVLIQTGKGGLDSNFGGIASNAFGTQGANEFIKRWTKILLVAFVISCVLLAMQVRGSDGEATSARRSSRVSRRAAREAQQVAPPASELPFDIQTDSPFEVQVEPEGEGDTESIIIEL